jgi:short subunit dehydrogenase-like uncharacterized protein
MPDVLLFGATGYTGRLTAHALAARGADFIVAGRNREQLENLASETGASGVAIAQVGDVPALAQAALDVRVILSCVGPFMSLGHTAAEAAIQARVNYLDCTGEGEFIAALIDRCDSPARAVRIGMAPALGFDEVPSDVAVTLAAEGLERPEVVVTYAVASRFSWGTLRSAMGIVSSPGREFQGGSRGNQAGREERWAPMPPPLGPSRGISFPMAEGCLAPLHLDLGSLKLFIVTSTPGRVGLRYLVPVVRAAQGLPGIRDLVNGALAHGTGGPNESERAGATWTILAEATAGGRRRNIVISGHDLYGLTAELLATAALEMATPGYDKKGVLAPVQAVSMDTWREELARNEVAIEVIDS